MIRALCIRSVAIAAMVSAAGLVTVQGCGSTRPLAAGDGTANGQGATSSDGLRVGPCEPEGATIDCHVETGRSGNIVNCFSGQQTCVGGQWGPCGGVGTTQSVDLTKTSLSPLTVSATTPSSTSAGCVANPCNPYCVGIDVDADSLQPDGGFSQFTIQGSIIDYSSFPTAKKNAIASPSCTVGHPPGDYKVCSYDYCCAASTDGGTSGGCVKWIDNTSSACTPASSTDYEVGVGCQDSSGAIHIPVCNRGTVDATSGTLLLAGYTANPTAAGTSAICANPGTANPGEGCTINLATINIKAGKCIEVNVTKGAAGQSPGIKCNSSADFGNGNRTTMINPPLTNFNSLPNLGSGNYTQLAEGDKCNNYSFVYTQVGSCATYGQQPPPPAPFQYDYTATCPAGYVVQWNQLAYATQIPSSSEVIFSASSAPIYDDGGTGTFSSAVTVADAKSYTDGGVAGDPATCSMSGTPTGCPKSLAAVPQPNSQNAVLRVGVTLIAYTAIPTVNSWQVTYNCIPKE